MASLGFEGGMTAAPRRKLPPRSSMEVGATRPAQPTGGGMSSLAGGMAGTLANDNQVRSAQPTGGGLATSAPRTPNYRTAGRTMNPTAGMGGLVGAANDFYNDYYRQVPQARPMGGFSGTAGPATNAGGGAVDQGRNLGGLVGATNEVYNQFPQGGGNTGFNGMVSDMPNVSQAVIDDYARQANQVGGMGGVANDYFNFTAPGYRTPEQDEALFRRQQVMTDAPLVRGLRRNRY